MQLDLNDCGVGAVDYIIKHYHGKVAIEKLRQMTYTNKTGTNMYLLKSCLIKLGFASSGYKIDFDKLNNYQFPLVAQIVKNNIKHFIVILKVNQNKVYCFDPAIGKVSYKKDIFLKWFSGYILTAYPQRKITYESSTNNFKIMLFSLLKRHRNSLIKLVLISTMISLLIFTDTYYLKLIIDKIDIFNNSNLIQLTILFLSLSLVRQLIVYINSNYLNTVFNQFDLSLMKILHNKLFSLPMSFFEQRTTGEVVNRLNAVNNFRNLLLELIGALGVNLIFLLFSSVLLWLINPLIFVFCLLLMVLLYLIYFVLKNKLKLLMYQLQDTEALYQNKLIEYINRAKTIFNLKINRFIINQVDNEYQVLIENSSDYVKSINIEVFIKNILISIFNFIIILISLISIKNGDISLGTLVQINTIIIYFIAPIEKLFSIEDLFRSCYIAYLRIKDMLDIDNIEYGNQVVNNIQISGLSYAYNGIDKVFDNFNFNINQYDKLLIMGPSGVGKSSLIKLLMGYDNNFTGSIKVNGNGAKSSRVVYLSQSELLFNGTIIENIILDLPYDETKIKQILRICQINVDLNTKVSADSNELSGGEAQRIKLARTLYRNFDILILDEALSEVNQSLEISIIKSLLSHYPNKTIIYISHHLYVKKLFNQHLNIERSCHVNK